jgi:DNA-binding CsgD family transcriptional regulator
MANIAAYSGMASFSLRPDTGSRMLPIGGVFLMGALAGGALFPRLSAWAAKGRSAARRVAVAAWLSAALLAVLPGFHHYAFNEPLRLFANLLLGMAVAPAYSLLFSRFPARWRGMWFGASLGAGLLCWYGLMSLAYAGPQAGGAHHPFLLRVYLVHTAAIAVQALLCIHALVLRPGPATISRAAYLPRPAARGATTQIRALTAGALLVYLLSGILDARLTPALPAAPISAAEVFPAVFAAIAATGTGWLLDRRPEMLFRHILPVCCWLFILTPALAVIGYGHALHGILRTSTAVAQFAFFVISSVAAAGLAPDPRRAVWYACRVYASRLLVIVGYMVWTRVFGFELGVTVLAAATLAFLVSALIRRVDFAIAPEGEAAEAAPEEAARPPAASPGPGVAGEKTAEDRARSFLATAGLTRREEEVAVLLLLGGDTTGGIASALGITESTTKKHITSVFRKVGVASRHDLHARFHAAMTANDDHMNGHERVGNGRP